MRFRNSRIRKPDPLFLLALLVGLGVVVTTTAQAENVDIETAAEDAGAWLALRPATGLSKKLDLHWLNNALERSEIKQLVGKKQVEVAKPFGEKGPVLGMSVRPNVNKSAARAGDSGIGAISEDRPDLYFSLNRRW